MFSLFDNDVFIYRRSLKVSIAKNHIRIIFEILLDSFELSIGVVLEPKELRWPAMVKDDFPATSTPVFKFNIIIDCK